MFHIFTEDAGFLTKELLKQQAKLVWLIHSDNESALSELRATSMKSEHEEEIMNLWQCTHNECFLRFIELCDHYGGIQTGRNTLVTKQLKHDLRSLAEQRSGIYIFILWKKETRLAVDRSRRSVLKEREREKSQTAINSFIRREELDFQLPLIPKLALIVISKCTERMKFLVASLSTQLQCVLIETFGVMCSKSMF